MTDYHSVKELGSHSLMGQQVLSCRRAWWLVLGLCALWGAKPHSTSIIAKHGAWGSFACVAVGYWHWVASWGSCGATKLAGLSCLVPTKQQRFWGLLVLWYGLLGATAAAAGMGEPSLWAARVLRSACLVWAPGGQYSSPVGKGDPSLQVVGALGPACWHGLPGATEAAVGTRDPSLQVVGALGSTCSHRLPGAMAAAVGTGDQSLWAAGVLEPASQVQASRSYRSCCSHRRTEPVGSGNLRPAC
jgi:hypothetical protein